MGVCASVPEDSRDTLGGELEKGEREEAGREMSLKACPNAAGANLLFFFFLLAMPLLSHSRPSLRLHSSQQRPQDQLGALPRRRRLVQGLRKQQGVRESDRDELDYQRDLECLSGRTAHDDVERSGRGRGGRGAARSSSSGSSSSCRRCRRRRRGRDRGPSDPRSCSPPDLRGTQGLGGRRGPALAPRGAPRGRRRPGRPRGRRARGEGAGRGRRRRGGRGREGEGGRRRFCRGRS